MKRIKLTQGQFTIVDDDLYELLNSLKWCAVYNKEIKNYYVRRTISKKNLPDGKSRPDALHWYVIGRPLKGLVVDHINGNSLDNRRENLRIATTRMNGQNRREHRAGGLPGCERSGKKWAARIRYKGKRIYIGTFMTREDAHLAYLNKVQEYCPLEAQK